MQIKHKLIAEVIKQWRSDSEERALAEAILYMTGLHLTDLQKMSTAEVTNVLTEVIRRPEEQRQIKQENKEESSTQDQQERIQKENYIEDYGEPSLQTPETDFQPDYTGQDKEIPETQHLESVPFEKPLSFIEAKKLRRGRKPNV